MPYFSQLPSSGWNNPGSEASANWSGPTSNGQGVYIPGHGYVGGAENIVQTVQGYDEGWYNQSDDNQFTRGEDGIWTDQAGARYDQQSGSVYDQNTNKWLTAPDDSGSYFRRRNDALNTTRNTMGTVAGWNPNASDNYEMDSLTGHRDWVNQVSGRIKTGDKVAHRIQWNLSPETGRWEPKVMGKEGWDTNADERMRLQMAIAMATAGVGMYAAPAVMAAEGAAGAAAAGATEAGLGGTIAAGTGAGAGTGGVMGTGMTMQQLGSAINMMNTVTGGNIPGLNIAGTVAGGWGSVGNIAGGTGSLMDYIKAAQSGAKLYGQGSGLFAENNPTQGGTGTGAAGGGTGMDLGFLNNLFNMGGAMYSANKNDNYADEMRRERERSLAERQPFLNRLNELSGDAGAEKFRTGGSWQAAERVGANKFTRQAAQAGGLSNDIQRTGQLQDLFMTHLDRERTGARGDLNAFDEKASRDALMKGIEMDRMKNSPLFAGAAYGAGGGQGTLTPQMIQQIMQMPGGLQYLQRITGMTGGSNDQSGAGEFGMGNRNEDFVPGPGQDYSNVSMPSDEIGNGGNDISSWLSDGAWDI